MKKLQGADVVLVSDNPDQLDHLHVWIRSEGAALRALRWSELQSGFSTAPAVVVADLTRNKGHDSLALCRGAWPLIALVDPGAAPLVALAWVQKWIAMPVHPADVVSSIISLTRADENEQSAPQALPPSRFDEALRSAAERQDTRALLALVNSTGPFRYTSILRFDGDQLSSVWTFDREQPTSDSFPLDKSIEASYCSLVRDTGKSVAFADSNLEPRVADHLARLQVLSYCGAPLRRDDGSIFGTLCHFDVTPRSFFDLTVSKLEAAALLVQESIAKAFARHT